MASKVFQNKGTALITGGASGVGFAFAQLCQKFGMNVALVDKSADGLEKARDVLSGTAKNGQRTEIYDMVCFARRSDLDFLDESNITNETIRMYLSSHNGGPSSLRWKPSSATSIS